MITNREVVLQVRKEGQRYFISGGLGWTALPETVQCRADFEKWSRNPGSYDFFTEDHKPAMMFEVKWAYNTVTKKHHPVAVENDQKTYVLNVSPEATEEQISDALKQRALQFKKEARIIFLEKRPEQHSDDDK